MHQLVDGAGESELGTKKIGTTKRGIGPTYAEKMNRSGIRCGDLLHFDSFPGMEEVEGEEGEEGEEEENDE